MKLLYSKAFEIQNWLESQNWRFCFIGGLAIQAWGEARLTDDIDISLFSGFGNESEIISKFLRKFRPRREDAEEFAKLFRVLLLISDDNIQIDVALGALPFEDEIIERSVLFEFIPGQLLRICAPEDLVTLKAYAARDKDWADVRGVLVRQHRKLDRNVILERLEFLSQFKDEDVISKLLKLFKETKC